MAVTAGIRQLHTRTAAGVNLSVHLWGDGPPELVLVHGFADHARVWSRFAASIAAEYSVLAVDLRGHGHSGWDPGGTYALADHVGDVLHVLDTFGTAPVVLIGHSLGAQIAIRVAAARRERLLGAVFVDFELRRNNSQSASHVRRKFSERLERYAGRGDYVRLLHRQLPLVELDVLDEYAQGALHQSSDGQLQERADPLLAGADDCIDAEATLACLKAIARPILLVRGAGSALFSRAAACELLVQIPQTRLVTVATAGHTVMLDNPEGFCAAVRPYVLKLLNHPGGVAAAG